jgi:hypothetical protein
MRNSIVFASLCSIASLLTAGCQIYLDLEPDQRLDASLAVDATPAADAAVGPPDAAAADASPPLFPSCVPRDSLDPPGSGACLPPRGFVGAWATLEGWYGDRFIAEAACSIFAIQPGNQSSFLIEMNCSQHSGDPFDHSQPVRIQLWNSLYALPPQLVAGERFMLRVAQYVSDEDSPEELYLTMRGEDGTLWLALTDADTFVPDQFLLDRLSLTADEWLAPIVVASETGVCPWEDHDQGGSVQRVAVDVTVPGDAPLRLIDRRTAYLGNAYRIEVGGMSHFSSPENEAWPSWQLLISAMDLCAE